MSMPSVATAELRYTSRCKVGHPITSRLAGEGCRSKRSKIWRRVNSFTSCVIQGARGSTTAARAWCGCRGKGWLWQDSVPGCFREWMWRDHRVVVSTTTSMPAVQRIFYFICFFILYLFYLPLTSALGSLRSPPQRPGALYRTGRVWRRCPRGA